MYVLPHMIKLDQLTSVVHRRSLIILECLSSSATLQCQFSYTFSVYYFICHFPQCYIQLFPSLQNLPAFANSRQIFTFRIWIRSSEWFSKQFRKGMNWGEFTKLKKTKKEVWLTLHPSKHGFSLSQLNRFCFWPNQVDLPRFFNHFSILLQVPENLNLVLILCNTLKL